VRVLVELDVTIEGVDEPFELARETVVRILDDLTEHVGNQFLAAEGEGRGDVVKEGRIAIVRCAPGVGDSEAVRTRERALTALK
jgi:hypothetical protein